MDSCRPVARLLFHRRLCVILLGAGKGNQKRPKQRPELLPSLNYRVMWSARRGCFRATLAQEALRKDQTLKGCLEPDSAGLEPTQLTQVRLYITTIGRGSVGRFMRVSSLEKLGSSSKEHSKLLIICQASVGRDWA